MPKYAITWEVEERIYQQGESYSNLSEKIEFTETLEQAAGIVAVGHTETQNASGVSVRLSN